ncbi:MAG: flagellar basal-body rod protein FlgG [Deltaproteobacteria bacterium]|nr:flagellar basal-body rod protein FlgG [Deltaproteobacteria bacterium]
MMRALFTAATGMEAQQSQIDTIANNIANVSTTGFKRSRTEFQDLFYETLRAPGAAGTDGSILPTGVQVGHGVQLAAVNTIYSAGDRVNTGNPLDLAIEGTGFFQILRPTGETVYTRDGTFKLDANGNVVTSLGYQLIPNIAVPPDTLSVTVLPDGTVNATQAGQTQPTNLGQVQLARFANPSGLRSAGYNLLEATQASGDPQTGIPQQDGFGNISAGFLEGSNVQVAEELVQMILAQRAFEVSSRVIQAGDEMLRVAAQLSQ